MKARRLSLEEVEDSALEGLFQEGLRRRLYVAPFILLSVMMLVAWDPAPWRWWVAGVALVFAVTRLAIEGWRARREGIQRTRLSVLLPVPATILMLVVSATGGVDSPVFLMMPLVTVFLSLFLRPKYGIVFALVGTVVALVLTVVAHREWVSTFVPLAFGGGARGSATDLLLYTRATVIVLALWWAALLGWVMRRAYRSAIQRAVDAHGQLLETQDESTKTLTTLAAEIAHELKNPLASVKGLAALVDRDVSGKTKERVDVLRREIDRMQEILESFLTFSRPLVPLDVAPVQLAEVAQQVAAIHEGMASERGASIRLDVKPEVVVKADVRKVKQVVINLVQNALDVTPSGGAVDVVVTSDGDGARLLVMDRGPGVLDAERAFEPGVTTKEKGSGLGLTVARLVARQHGGDVRLLPRDDGGTVAELTLAGAPPS
jgi:signal transduction histidine kinase